MTWEPGRLREDVERQPALLRSLADAVRAGSPWNGLTRPRAVVLLGMGSSSYVAGVIASRLRACGMMALAESAATEQSCAGGPDDLVVAISAGGTSAETLQAVERYPSAVAVTNRPESPLAVMAGTVVDMRAGTEVSGVASLTYLATLVRLLELEVWLTDDSPSARGRLADQVVRAADAIDQLLATAPEWRDGALADLVGPDGTWFLAPVERLASAQQSALMMRECPRRAATGCETAEWTHVDVYLTRTLDYRALLFAGSRWDGAATDWMRQRSSTFWTVGDMDPSAAAGAARSLRYPGDEDPVVALLVEVTVAQVVAAALPVPA